jgi:hypothetical protein
MRHVERIFAGPIRLELSGDETPGNLRDRPCACQAHGDLELFAEVFVNGSNTHPAAKRQSVHDWPTDGNCIGAKRQRLEDVLSSAYAAIDDNWDASADGVGDARQDRKRRWNVIEVATAVIRNLYGATSTFDSFDRHLRGQYSLENHG